MRWYNGIRGCGLRQKILLQCFAREFTAEIMVEVIGDKIGAVSLITIEAVRLAESVVQSGVESAGRRPAYTTAESARPAAIPPSLRRRLCGTPVPDVQARSMGCPTSVQPPRMRPMRSTNAFMAVKVAS